MATDKADPPTAQDPLEKEANDRLREARKQKSAWSQDFRECYFFAAPHRQRFVTSTTQPADAPVQDASELQTSLAFLLSQDFVTEVVNTLMTEAQAWCERGRGMFVPEDAWSKVSEDVRKGDAQIFEAIKASNFYSEIPKAYYPDLSIGTVAVWIERRRPHEAIKVMAIPLRELEINLGPDGSIDDRFAVRYTRNSYVRALLPKGVTLPADVVDEIDKNPAKQTQVVWGFWRLWDDETDEVWQHVILVKEKLVHQAVLKGEGCCPLIVSRFNPSADWPFGLGPLIQGLPDLRQVDELEGRKIEAVGRNINGPISYPHDSFANVEQGLEDGFAYPIQLGHQEAIKSIYGQVDIQSAVFQHEEMEHRLQKLFFIDYPEQTGDTPPTLGQWLDELARAQRRLGTPGMPFWHEGPAAYFIRFKYLLEKAGTIQAIKVDGNLVSTRPMNPAQRAAEQQEIAMAVQAIQILGQAFPEEFKAAVDGRKTMEAFLNKMRVKLLVFRGKDDVDAAIGVISKLIGGQTPAGQPQPATGVA